MKATEKYPLVGITMSTFTRKYLYHFIIMRSLLNCILQNFSGPQFSYTVFSKIVISKSPLKAIIYVGAPAIRLAVETVARMGTVKRMFH
jgi:hypothetical protein